MTKQQGPKTQPMLQSLYIKNYVLIDELEIDFHEQMTVFTGETGAGKSIIMGALSLAIGERAESRVIGPFAESTEVVAHFELSPDATAVTWLKEQDLWHDEPLHLRRSINAQGRSKLWINGRPTPLSLARELGQLLIQIHGQHDQVKLLQSKYQREVLDAAGDHELTLKQTQTATKQWQQTQSEKNHLNQQGALSEEQSQLLHYQMEELDALALQSGEYESLHQQLKAMSHAQDLIEASSEADQLLAAGDQNALQIINAAQQSLNRAQSLTDAVDFKEILGMLNEAEINLSEAQQALAQISESIESNPQALLEIERRLDQINQIARKQQVMPELLASHQQQMLENLQAHQDLAQRKLDIEAAEKDAMDQFRKASQQLHTKRQHAAKQLATAIQGTIQKLGMPEAKFMIEITHDDTAIPSSLGSDQVQFLIASNQGQTAQPLNKTASGGELSRIALAIELHCAQGDGGSFVFDEVDTGIGGATAEQVGSLMQQLSQDHQVFTVTHLPQVAGHAHDHILVSKASKNKKTTSALEHLDEDARIQELARMAGGQEITEATLAQAREFLKTG